MSSDMWLIIGPIAIAVTGWFVGMEIKRLRNQVDQLLENQKEMAVQIARLEAKIRSKNEMISNVLLVGFRGPGKFPWVFLYIGPNENY